MNRNVKLVISFLVAVCLFFGIYTLTRESGDDNLKSITFNIVSLRDDYFVSETYQTDKEFLAEFLKEIDGITYEDSQYGMFVTAVDGFSEDYDEQYWWAILVDDSMAIVGSEEIVLKDGSKYTLELIQGY